MFLRRLCSKACLPVSFRSEKILVNTRNSRNFLFFLLCLNMVVESFEIVFDRVSKTYFSGEKVSGHILIVADQPENIEALGLRLWGKASVCWSEGSNSNKSNKRKSRPSVTSGGDGLKEMEDENLICEEESYFDRRVSLLDKTGPENIVIPSGKNTFQFEVALPVGIPSSFEGDHGQVYYFIEAVMKRAGGNSDMEVKTKIPVKGILDLNNSHEARVERPEVASEKSLCCLCCKSGPLGFHFRVLGKSGMIPGEKIPFSAEAYNMSCSGAVCLTLRFVQTITYSSKDKANVIRKELFKMKGPCISRGGTGLWNNESIDLPNDLPPTKLAGRSQIINVEYYFDVVLEIPRVSNLSAQIPVVIGTIPFGSSVEEVITEGLD